VLQRLQHPTFKPQSPLSPRFVNNAHPKRTNTQGEHYIDLNITLQAESAVISGAGSFPFTPLGLNRRIFFDLVGPADAPDPIGPLEGALPNGAGSDPADSVAMKYYCALNFNVGGKVYGNRTVARVAEDGPLSPGAFQCARECNKAGDECAAFGVVAGNSCFLMSSVRWAMGGGDE